MARDRSICQRCHRLRPVNAARYCAGCDAELRAAERRRPVFEPPAADPPTALPPDLPIGADPPTVSLPNLSIGSGPLFMLPELGDSDHEG